MLYLWVLTFFKIPSTAIGQIDHRLTAPLPEPEYSGPRRRCIYASDLDGCPRCVSLIPDGHYFMRLPDRKHAWRLRLDIEASDSVICSSRSSCRRCSVRGKCIGCNSELQCPQCVTWPLFAPNSSGQRQIDERSRSPPESRKTLCYYTR